MLKKSLIYGFVKELFLEDFDSMLTSGNIPDLFDPDELDSILMELKNDAAIEGISEEKTELYKYLINVCLIFKIIPNFRLNL